MKSGPRKINAVLTNIARSNALFVLIIVFLTALVYSSAVNNGFTSWDDNHYVTGNRFIKDFSGEDLIKLWTERTGMGGTRLTLTSFMIDYHLWGLNPKYYHLENIVWHILNALLVYFLILKLFKNRKISFITAILFAIHPMHVESVAWISARKDVLYTFFLLVCLHTYIAYIQKKRFLLKGLLWLAFTISFILSWHSKFSAVAIPALLFLIDYVLKRRLTVWLILEKLPILLFTGMEVYRIAFGPHARMDFYGRKLIPSIHETYRYTLFEKSLLAGYSLAFYMVRFFFPVQLSAIVPYPAKTGGLFPTEYYLALGFMLVILAGVAILFFRLKKNRKEYIFGFLFFLIPISAFLHFISIKGVVVVADRYTYVPYIGLGFMVGVFLYNLRNGRLKKVCTGVFLVLVAVMSVLSFQRNKIWKNDLTLYTDVLDKNPDVVQALNNRGIAYNNRGKYTLAIADFNRGVKLEPDFKYLYNNRARSYFQIDSIDLALADLEKAISMDPYYLDAYLNKAQVLLSVGKTEQAIESYSRACEIAPYRARIYISRAQAYLKIDQTEKALNDYHKAIEVYPTYFKPYYELGRLYNEQHELQKAVSNLEKARGLNPHIPELYNELGDVHNKLKYYHTALEYLNKALELEPSLPQAYNNRGISNFNLGNVDAAMSDFTRSIQNDSLFSRAYSNRGNVYASMEEFELALKNYNKAVQIDPEDCINLVNRGNAHFQIGQTDSACADWHRALECGFQQAENLIKTHCE